MWYSASFGGLVTCYRLSAGVGNNDGREAYSSYVCAFFSQGVLVPVLPEPHPLLHAMDFRRVEQKYQLCALLVHMALLGCLFAYATFQVFRIIWSANNPPVQVTTEKWSAAGKWALCGGNVHEFRFGTKMPAVDFANPAKDSDWTGIDMYFTVETVSYNGPVADYEDNCSILDLSSWQPPASPTRFWLCVDSHTNLYLQSQGRWRRLVQALQGSQTQLSLTMQKLGWNLGYSSSMDSFYSATIDRHFCCGNFTDWCSYWTPARSHVRRASFFEVHIESPIVLVTIQQGIVPQIFGLCASLGGFMSLLTTIFTVLFIRKHMNSDAANFLELRTLFADGLFPQNHKQIQQQLEDVAAVDAGSGLGTNMPTNLVLGRESRESCCSGMPALPPYKASE